MCLQRGDYEFLSVSLFINRDRRGRVISAQVCSPDGFLLTRPMTPEVASFLVACLNTLPLSVAQLVES